MLEPVKSQEAILDWLSIYFKRTGRQAYNGHDRALPLRAFLRYLKLGPSYFQACRDGRRHFSPRYVKALSRFIDEWEGGYFEVVKVGRLGRELKRLEFPKAPRMTFKVSLEYATPRLFQAPVANKVLPERHLSPFPT